VFYNFNFLFLPVALYEYKAKQDATRKFIAKEMLSTEKSYYESLCVGLNFYQKPLVAKVSSFMRISEISISSL
jgi:hypothetical protein